MESPISNEHKCVLSFHHWCRAAKNFAGGKGLRLRDCNRVEVVRHLGAGFMNGASELNCSHNR